MVGKTVGWEPPFPKNAINTTHFLICLADPARVELITSAFGFSAVPHPRNVDEAREMLDGFILKIASGNADLPHSNDVSELAEAAGRAQTAYGTQAGSSWTLRRRFRPCSRSLLESRVSLASRMKGRTKKLNVEAQRLAFGFDPLKEPQPANVEYLIAAAALHTLRTDFSVLRH
jgi:hypothetical protein